MNVSYRLFATTLLFVLGFLGVATQDLKAQMTIDHTVTTFPTTLSNITSAGGQTAIGMQGACPNLPCCSTQVIKVVLPFDAVLRVEMVNFTPLAGSLIAYRSTVANPTDFSDLAFISATVGNFCGFRDTLQLGRGVAGWDNTPYGQTPTAIKPFTAIYDFNAPSTQAGFFPAGDYYIMMFNENQQAGNLGGGSITDITFEVAQACAPLDVPASMDFGSLEFNSQSDTLSFYVKNNRQLDVSIDPNTGVSLSGTDTSQFSILTYPDTVLSVGDSSLVEVIFTPTSGGAKTASFDIAFSDTICSTDNSVVLNGTGAEPEMVILGNGISISNNDLTPATNDNTDFGAIVVNTGSITNSFVVTNTGTDTLLLTGSPVVDLIGSAPFTVLSNPASSIPPGDSSTFSIVYTPTSTGLDTVDVVIANNDSSQSTFTYRLYGTAAGLNGLHFDGANDYVDITTVGPEMTDVTTWTLEAWIKADPTQTGTDHILAVNTTGSGNIMLFRLNDGLLSFFDGSSSHEISGLDLRDDVWHHVAATYDNASVKLYVDGQVELTATVGAVDFDLTDRWSLGQEFDGATSTGDFFKGALNEVRIWKDVRTNQEIAGSRFCELQDPSSDTNLVAYYTANQGVPSGNNTSITALTDWSGNGYDGTLINFARSGATSNFIEATNVGAGCTSLSVGVCDALTYTSPSGNIYDSTGVYIDTVMTSNGDSILYIDLSINFSQETQDLLMDTTVCDTIIAVAQTSLTPFATFENGDADWVEINGSVDSLVNTNRSVFLWMREEDQVSGDQDVLVGINTSGTGTVTNFGIATNEQLWINDGGTNRNSGVVVTDGLWHFVGYTYDEASNLTQFWVDGVEAASFTNGQSISSTSRISIGQEFDGSTTSNFYDGDMTQLSIWNEVLDSTDIIAIMQASIQNTHPKYANLKAYYPMTEDCGSTGFTLEDFGPHGYDGAASATDIVITDSLVDITGFNAAPLYTKEWTALGSAVSTQDTLLLTGSLQAGAYSLSLKRDFFEINDGWNVTLQPSCSGPIVALSVDSNVSCNNLFDGGATASTTGGSSPYTYTWSNSATTASITGVAAGTYSVTVTDQNGNTDSSSISITEPAALFAASVVDSNVTCNGLFDGGATASATGGTMAYTYTWSNSATTASITGVGAGTYSVTITDANGCTDSTLVTIIEPAALVAAAVLDSNDAGSGGGATASATGGTMAYTYTWSNGATTASIAGATAGTYSITITDANGCTDSASVAIASGPSASIALDSNVSCNGLSDGGLTASASGGTTPYTYAWSNSATTASITGVVATTYTVTITDQNGLTATSSETITEPAVLIAATVVDSNISCNGFFDGGATASATGGTASYTYTWSNSATTASITGVGAGTYSVTITDQNGCTDSSSATIIQPNLLVASAVLDSNDAGSGGGATASATGGTATYTYTWSNGATTSSVTALSAGTYSVTITDQNGCTDSASVTITAGPIPSIALDSNVSCNGLSDGGLTASATGGTTPYTYAWSNGATTASITGVVATTYTVTITDQNGLTASSSETITEPAVLIAATAVDSNISCNGFSDGGATASATGGTMAYTYTWSNGATTVSITGVVAGTYSVTITDQNGCTDSASLTITEPIVLAAASVLDSNVTCNGFSNGGATASATGGTAAYTYTWSNGASTSSATSLFAGTYSVTITDQNGCTDSTSVSITEPIALAAASVVDSTVSCNGFSNGGATASATGGTGAYTYTWSNSATTASITGVVAGTYSVTVTDQNGCTDSTALTITEPATLTAASVVDSNVSCNSLSDGGATASVTGGTMPYTYAWSNSATTASITGVVVGTYSVTITDQNGCTDSTSVTITEPAVLAAASIVDSNATCNGFSNGGATASSTGGTMPYTYAWSASTGSATIATTASITGILAGTYSVTITDANGCTDSTSVTITEPAALVSASVVDSTVSCNGFSDGGGTASAIGGTGTYTYTWSNGATTASITGVSAGAYSVTITDQNGCTDSTTAIITEPAVLQLSINVDTNESCAGLANGVMTAQATGGTLTYTYAWSASTGSAPIATTASINGLSAGTYSVTVTDANGCSISAVDSVIIEDVIAPTVITRNLTVYLDANGQASITAAQIDSASFDACTIDTIFLDSTDFNCSEVGANTVVLTAVDVNGNSDTASATVMVLDTIAPTVIAQNLTLYLDANGMASVTPAIIDSASFDNCGVDSIALDSTSFDCSETGANTVTLSVYDVNGNMNTAQVVVTVMDTIAPTVFTQNITVYLDINGEATTTAAAIDSSSFDNCSIASMTLDSTDFECAEIGVNTVVLTVTDASGNVSTGTATVNVLDTLAPTVIAQNITVYLDANGEVSITPAAVDNGSVDNCSIDFLTLDSMNFDCSEIGANTVMFAVTDVFGNSDTTSAVVTVLDTLAPTVLTQNVTVYLDASGQASTTIAAINNGSLDNCGIATLSLDSTDFDCSEVGANTVVLTITDVNGNTDTASAIVTVMDTLDATVITQNVTVYLDANGTASTTAAAIDNGSFDNCGVATVVLDSTSFDCSETGINTVTLTVTDDNGNSATGTAVVTVLDTIAPVLIVGIDTALCSTDAAGTVVSFSNFASDNCDTMGIVQLAGLPSGSTFPIGITTNVFEVSDPSGNITTDSFTVEVYDFPVLSIDSVGILCETADEVSLTGLPTGGVFSGNGVTGSSFDPTAVSPGNEELTYTYTTAENCVYSTSIFANVRENPEVILGLFPDTICIELDVVACPVATPAGGVYSGLGVDSILFYTQTAGIGEHWISYTYEDSYGCSDTDSTLARVVRCIDPLGVADQAASVEASKVYPNPNRGTFTVKHGYSDQIELHIYSSDGALVRYIPQLQGQHEISLDQWTQGVFYLQLTGAQVSETLRVVVQ